MNPIYIWVAAANVLRILNKGLGSTPPNPELLRHMQYFRHPNQNPNYPVDFPMLLYTNKNNIPDKPGVYGWYFDSYLFDKLFDDASKADFAQNAIKIEMPGVVSKEYYLMYIGITERTLRERIYNEHLNANSKASTFRQSLAALLYDDIGLDPRKQLNGKEEITRLNSWIFEHARVAWITIDNPEPVEIEFIKRYGKVLPLNIDDNDYNPWRKKLKALRKNWRAFG
jgi:hypothetical protein